METCWVCINTAPYTIRHSQSIHSSSNWLDHREPLKHSKSVCTETDSRQISSRQGLDSDQAARKPHKRSCGPVWPSFRNRCKHSIRSVTKADCGDVLIFMLAPQKHGLRGTWIKQGLNQRTETKQQSLAKAEKLSVGCQGRKDTGRNRAMKVYQVTV